MKHIAAELSTGIAKQLLLEVAWRGMRNCRSGATFQSLARLRHQRLSVVPSNPHIMTSINETEKVVANFLRIADPSARTAVR